MFIIGEIGGRVYGISVYLPLQFFCKLKTVLKARAYFTNLIFNTGSFLNVCLKFLKISVRVFFCDFNRFGLCPNITELLLRLIYE